ncbi:MAG: hypothetical protein HYV07_33440 [Deltaproteobacteria bacterium]|nr:hypothetical protein [Deltaproteobacteria bacterium]
MRHRLALASLLALPGPACSDSEEPKPAWKPGIVYDSPGLTPRGLVDVRGLVHAHSVYSHDACDDEPVKNGVRDPVCFDDFRRGLCQTRQDFVFLTDHPSDFAETPFTEALLHRAERGDTYVESNGGPVAAWLACEDGHKTLVLPGTESDLMPVGLDAHIPSKSYGQRTVAGVAEMRASGAIVLKAHTEDTNPDEIIALGLDGFEMHNLHANAIMAAGTLLELLVLNAEKSPELPVPDLALLPMLSEDPRYMATWGTVLSRGHRAITTMGTDCHRNSFPALLADGERADSYRRMMMVMSNHLLVRPRSDGSFGPEELEEALRTARAYGAFEVMGYPLGFDFHAEDGSELVEMGGEAHLGARLVARLPSVQDLDPTQRAPELFARILRAREGGFDEVARAQGDATFTVTSTGAYRAEVRMKPRHLERMLGRYRQDAVFTERVWVYSNPIYVK